MPFWADGMDQVHSSTFKALWALKVKRKKEKVRLKGRIGFIFLARYVVVEHASNMKLLIPLHV